MKILSFMPSLFQPCGISQMLAMRNGNLCLAHSTGGLKDKIINMKNDFAFDGKANDIKIMNTVKSFDEALQIYPVNIWLNIPV